jgi:hypothetical protein
MFRPLRLSEVLITFLLSVFSSNFYSDCILVQYFVIYILFFSSCGCTAKFWALATFIKLSVSFRLLDLGQSAGLIGRVISSSQGLC